MGFLSLIFGSGGGAETALGGQFYLVGLFILIFFILYLAGSRASAENIIFVVLSFFLLVISTGLFDFPLEIIMMPLVFIGLFIGFYAYYIFYKPD